MEQTGMMATYPARKNSLLQMLPTVLCQLDQLYIYCNQYTQKDLMELNHWLMNHKNGCVTKLVDAKYTEGNVQDMGKFWALSNQEGYIFLLDDDLMYPKDYCKRHIQAIQLHQGISTVHGRVVQNYPLRDYFKDTKSFHYRQAVKKYIQVDIPGTGTTAFRLSDIKGSIYADTNAMVKYKGMGDIWFACQAKFSGTNIFTLPRQYKWLTDIPQSNSSSLYHKHKNDTSEHCRILNQLSWST